MAGRWARVGRPGLMVKGNLCAGVVRYRRPPRGWLLDSNELAKLGTVLCLREDEMPVCVAAVRLIMLSGCRSAEMRCLRRCGVKRDGLTSIYVKTRPDRGTFCLAVRCGSCGTASPKQRPGSGCSRQGRGRIVEQA